MLAIEYPVGDIAREGKLPDAAENEARRDEIGDRGLELTYEARGEDMVCAQKSQKYDTQYGNDPWACAYYARVRVSPHDTEIVVVAHEFA